ncbi:hypothetical protein B296_00049267 [Ensete ventricosum]|uniref:DUF1645 domain-containing protein n=1 Tax=Ensete ventricosum TaxID=4639 RepID=A0A426Y1T6_ENSVE|nr:hypothetical protein B296_00049267 [Ensete ventricosum]
MQGGGEGDVPLITASPSFRVTFEEAFSAVHCESSQQEPPPPDDGGGDDSDIDVDDDFEFAVVIKDPETGAAMYADEIFADGRIRPIYPVFNRALLDDDRFGSSGGEGEDDTSALRGTLRRLLIEERPENPVSASSAGAEELEGIPTGTYCVWSPRSSAAPSPSRCRKSRSTGSSLRWRLRDLVLGRSHSDGKEKFVFLAAEEKKSKESPSSGTKGQAGKSKERTTKSRGKGGKGTEVDVVTAYRIYYGKGGQATGSGAARRSFLPYKKDLVGLFANVNGITRSHHPF